MSRIHHELSRSHELEWSRDFLEFLRDHYMGFEEYAEALELFNNAQGDKTNLSSQLNYQTGDGR